MHKNNDPEEGKAGAEEKEEKVAESDAQTEKKVVN